VEPYRPSKDEIARAEGATIGDVIAPDLDVLFCGINPGLYSGATGKHFARPGNRFWKTLHHSGFTPRVLSPFEQEEMLRYGLGITNMASRATAQAASLTQDELRVGGRALREKVLEFRPAALAILGVVAFRVAFEQPKATLGLQGSSIGPTAVWVLPNPSGLNAHYQVPRLTEMFDELRRSVRD
jgi:TDG/mug DNA glycosylase family protein